MVDDRTGSRAAFEKWRTLLDAHVRAGLTIDGHLLEELMNGHMVAILRRIDELTRESRIGAIDKADVPGHSATKLLEVMACSARPSVKVSDGRCAGRGSSALKP